MPAAKKTSPTTAAPKKAASTPSHPSYKDMIKEAILSLKERNGSSRPALKKYILANHKSLAASTAVFDQQFNKALRTGVEKGEFHQPKGSSGTVKLAKKEPAKKSTSPTGAAKKTATGDKAKKPATKTATKKKATSTTAAAGAPKKEKTPAAKKAAKPKANTSTKRTKKTATSTTAPAVVDTPKVLSKTKSGRVTKTPAKAASKPAAKKGAPKKAAAPKKEKKEPAAAPAEA